MSSESEANGRHEYVVVSRAASAAMFEPSSLLRVNVPRPAGEAVLTFQTRHLDRGLEHPLPGELWVDARGPASSLEEAVSVFGNAAGTVVPVIAFGTNAAIGGLEPELAYDNTPGLTKRDFLQSMLPDEPPILHLRRRVNVGAIIALMKAIEEHGEKDRIHRAISQYSLGLRHWRWGHEILATAHLFMGMEALTKAMVRARPNYSGLSQDEIAARLGIETDRLDPSQRLETEILARVRCAELFQGDEDCHRDAKAASDGFEHGYMPFDQIRDRALNVRDRTAAYLREAILNLVGIEDAHRATLLAPPFDQPLGNWPVVKYVRGHLLGDSDDLASEENEYPIMSWRSKITSSEIDEAGDHRLRFDDQVTAHLGEGITFQLMSHEVWKP